jgi:hypothetical protein
MSARRFGTTGLILLSFAAGACTTNDPIPPLVGAAPPASLQERCLLSVDCGAGRHCVLGLCESACDDATACEAGGRCSARGRCLAAGEPDKDPPPPTAPRGELTATPTSIALTDDVASFPIVLQSTSPEPVSFRIEVEGAHLSVPNAGGSFTGSTTVSVSVKPDAVAAAVTPGHVRIVTDLGAVTVTAPLRLGLGGRYSGTIHYDDTELPLGSSQFAGDLFVDGSDLAFAFDTSSSMLFPMAGAYVPTARGTYSLPDRSLSFTLDRVFPRAEADADVLARPVGDRLHTILKVSLDGSLKGSFSEQVYGITKQPVELSGHMELVRTSPAAQQARPTVQSAVDVTALGRVAAIRKTVREIFQWTDPDLNYDCTHITRSCACGLDAPCELSGGQLVQGAADKCVGNYRETQISTSLPVSTLGDACRTSFARVHSAGEYGMQSTATTCGLLGPLACAFELSLDDETRQSVPRAGQQSLRLLLAPALIAAKQDLVDAQFASLQGDASTENSHLLSAFETLAHVGKWVLQRDLLEALRSLPEGAKSRDELGATQEMLVDFVSTFSRVFAAREELSLSARVAAAETQAVSGTVWATAIAVRQLLQGWHDAVPGLPPEPRLEVLGVLDEVVERASSSAMDERLDRIPFVFRPEEAARGPTNFEQVLSNAEQSLDDLRLAEDSFVASRRTYEGESRGSQGELSRVSQLYDGRVADICGTSLAAESLDASFSLKACASTGLGMLASLAVELDAAKQRVANDQEILQFAKDKIAIDETTLAETQRVHRDTLIFLTASGTAISAAVFAEGVITAVQGAIQVASNASAVNVGIPITLGAVVGGLGGVKAGIEATRVLLQQSQSWQLEDAAAQREYIAGMAEIKKAGIDLAARALDAQMNAKALLEVEVRIRTLQTELLQLVAARRAALDSIAKTLSEKDGFRVVEDSTARLALGARSRSQLQIEMAARALEYETNEHFPGVADAGARARTSLQLKLFASCLGDIYRSFRSAFGSPQGYTTDISVRELLGVTQERVDPVTGERITTGAQFRNLLLRSENFDSDGAVVLGFSTNLDPGNGLWSASTCNDRITTVQAQLVGDTLGDSAAELQVSLGGTGLMRACGSDEIRAWTFGDASGAASDRFAVIQAGVNTFEKSIPNRSLQGEPVGRANWKVRVPSSRAAPSNADVNLAGLDDIRLLVAHEAVPAQTRPGPLDTTCLSTF